MKIGRGDKRKRMDKTKKKKVEEMEIGREEVE